MCYRRYAVTAYGLDYTGSAGHGVVHAGPSSDAWLKVGRLRREMLPGPPSVDRPRALNLFNQLNLNQDTMDETNTLEQAPYFDEIVTIEQLTELLGCCA